jgi:uncharacterized protein YifE (UPF0438 family)
MTYSSSREFTGAFVPGGSGYPVGRYDNIMYGHTRTRVTVPAAMAGRSCDTEPDGSIPQAKPGRPPYNIIDCHTKGVFATSLCTLLSYYYIALGDVADAFPRSRTTLRTRRNFPARHRGFPIRHGNFPARYGDFVIRDRNFPTRYGDFLSRRRNFPARSGDFLIRYGNFPTRYGDSLSRYRNFPARCGDFPSRYGKLLSRYGDFPARYGSLITPGKTCGMSLQNKTGRTCDSMILQFKIKQ